MARKKQPVDGPTYYTTYQVAKVFGVSVATVVNWVNAEKLHAHRTPGGHRRIARSDLLLFARQHEYPVRDSSLLATEHPPRILVVDDESDFSEMVRDYLRHRGDFEVEVADSGFQAGFAVARFKPDLILMDIMMPGMDGFQVLSMIRGDAEMRHIPVIACTAFRDAEVDVRVREERFDGFVEKPLKLKELLELIQATLSFQVPTTG